MEDPKNLMLMGIPMGEISAWVEGIIIIVLIIDNLQLAMLGTSKFSPMYFILEIWISFSCLIFYVDLGFV